MSTPTETRRDQQLLRRITRDMERLIVNSLRIVDRNGDGHLSSEEGVALITVTRSQAPSTQASGPSAGSPTEALIPRVQTLPYSAEPTSVVVDDSTLFNRAQLGERIATQYRLTAERADQLIRRALPNGVADVTVGNLCSANPDLNCAPLPNNKVVHFRTPPIRS